MQSPVESEKDEAQDMLCVVFSLYRSFNLYLIL